MFRKCNYLITLSGDRLNEYIKGRVSGMIQAIIDPRVKYTKYCGRWYDNVITGQTKFYFSATKRQLRKVKKMVNGYYSNSINIVFE